MIKVTTINRLDTREVVDNYKDLAEFIEDVSEMRSIMRIEVLIKYNANTGEGVFEGTDGNGKLIIGSIIEEVRNRVAPTIEDILQEIN